MKKLAVVAVVLLSGCSHTSQVASVEKSATVALNKQAVAKAKVLARVSDYMQEARYGVTLAPPSKTLDGVSAVLTLGIDLAGPGSLAETQRQAFMQSLVRDDAQAHEDLAQASQDNLDLLAAVTKSNAKVVETQRQLFVAANNAATVADNYNSFLRYALLCLAVMAVYFVLRMGLTIAGKSFSL